MIMLAEEEERLIRQYQFEWNMLMQELGYEQKDQETSSLLSEEYLDRLLDLQQQVGGIAKVKIQGGSRGKVLGTREFTIVILILLFSLDSKLLGSLDT